MCNKELRRGQSLMTAFAVFQSLNSQHPQASHHPLSISSCQPDVPESRTDMHNHKSQSEPARTPLTPILQMRKLALRDCRTCPWAPALYRAVKNLNPALIQSLQALLSSQGVHRPPQQGISHVALEGSSSLGLRSLVC